MYYIEGEVNEEWAIAKVETQAAVQLTVLLLGDFIRAIENGETDKDLLISFQDTRNHLKKWANINWSDAQFEKMFNFKKEN